MDTYQFIVAFLVGCAVIIGIAFLVREVICWYFKTTLIAERLTEIRDLLKAQAVADAVTSDGPVQQSEQPFAKVDSIPQNKV
ncbi:hypothetical protein KQI63_15750 [bacterium]|nr:hypothetical protein [bacterium]